MNGIEKNLLLIGCGNMAGALLKGWVDSALAVEFDHIEVVKPSPPSQDLQFDGVPFYTSLGALQHQPTVVVWGVKPHQLEKVVAPSVAHCGKDAVYISIAAGKTLANLEAMAGGGTKLVRAMPNTPVAIREGITGLCANKAVDGISRQLVGDLFSHVGEAPWLDEGQMNALTALCGSGPAYVFYFMECLAEAAEALGLPKDQADGLARQMVRGSAGLANQSAQALATLRQNVTSPGGTTAAALDVWMQAGTLDVQAKQALKAAVRRAVELEN